MAAFVPTLSVPFITSKLTSTANLGGPFQGYSTKQTLLNFKDSDNVMARRVLVKSWNTPYAVGKVNGYSRITTPFRAINNSGDFLSRTHYICGGPNPTNADRPGRKVSIGSIISACDGTGVPASSCNVRFVADSSDYIKFKKYQAINRNYNDLTNGGDQSHAACVLLMHVRRF
jgi:hypothetical protein